jgi:hypothetical protein
LPSGDKNGRYVPERAVISSTFKSLASEAGSALARVAVIHALNVNSRLTTQDFVLSFARYSSGQDVTLINALGPISPAMLSAKFDLVLLTYDFLALREGNIWRQILQRVRDIIHRAGIVALLPQDDYTMSAELDRLALRARAAVVFTPLHSSLDVLYPKSLAAGVKFETVLTGYLESSHLTTFNQFSRPFKEREIDFGQRVSRLPAYFGVTATAKAELSILFGKEVAAAGFTTNISTQRQDAFVGTAWLAFLGNTRFTMSHKGGASVADPRGVLGFKTEWFARRHPEWDSRKILTHLHLSRYPQGNFSAVSPRLFESAAMCVCQIMPTDDYPGELSPWEHYLPLASDLSNVNEILEAMRDTSMCEGIARECQETVLNREELSYSGFVSTIYSATLGKIDTSKTSAVVICGQEFEGGGSSWATLLPVVQWEVRRAWASGDLKRRAAILQQADTSWEAELEFPEYFKSSDHRRILATWMRAASAGHLSLASVTIPWVSGARLLGQPELVG